MKACPFCQIIAGASPGYRIYEDQTVLVILAIPQDVVGHLLVLPKKHVVTLEQADLTTLTALQAVIQVVTRHLVTDCGYDGVNLLCASGAAAGQSVSHLHWHVIPRQEGDGHDAWPKLRDTAIPPLDTLVRLLRC